MVSNRPGLTVRPVSDTRTACMNAPAFTPRASAVPRTACSIVGGVEGRGVGQRRRRARPGARPSPASDAWRPQQGRTPPDGRAGRVPRGCRRGASCGAAAAPARARARAAAHRRIGTPEPGLFEPGARVRNQHVVGHLHDVLVVHPFELLGIEHGVAAADALEIEALDQFVGREQFLIGRRATTRAGRGSSPSPRARCPARSTPSPTSRRAACSGASCRARGSAARARSRAPARRAPGTATPAWACSRCDRRRGSPA